ncbi:extracellular solute-binding protein [Paenibacillus contaminans]|uniref:Sugar ABC transporter substrate-binding protein n=1 Tax=Paenibacillus contaminans TaxID=450362 RepID=A0A329MUX4_9BACL|nr:extracellular solute-binding protein [Paenibacillus contaminans]RAV23098.1 hypothetical protein DQG23_02575 [Paenibacillus contaminans]
MIKQVSNWKLKLFSGLVITALTATACSSGSGSNPSSSPSPASSPKATENNENANKTEKPNQDPVTIRIGTNLYNEAWENKETWAKFTADFKKKYPWITLEFIFTGMGSEVKEALNRQIAAKEPYDVFWGSTLRDFVDEGYAENLTPYIEKSPDFKAFKFKPGVIDSFQINGQQWALSRGNDAFLLFINKDIFAQRGVDLPKNNWTWDDFRKTAIALTDPGKKTWGLQDISSWELFITGVIPYSNGHTTNTRMLSKDHRTSIANSPEVLEDLQWFQDLKLKDGAALTSKLMSENKIEGDTWMTGNAAITVQPSPIIPVYNSQVKFNWDIVPLPAGTAQQKGIGFNSPMFLAKASKNKEAAWTFMKWWTTDPDAQRILQDIGGTFPATNDEKLVDAFKNAEVYSKVNKEALAIAASVTEPDMWGTVPAGDKGMTAYEGFRKAEEEGKTAYDYYPQAVEKLNKEFAEAWSKTTK